MCLNDVIKEKAEFFNLHSTCGWCFMQHLLKLAAKLNVTIANKSDTCVTFESIKHPTAVFVYFRTPIQNKHNLKYIWIERNAVLQYSQFYIIIEKLN